MKILRPNCSIACILTIVFFALPITAQSLKTIPSDKSKVSDAMSSISPTPIEEEILQQINLLRTNPTKYSTTLESMKASMNRNVVSLPDGRLWQMNEGAPAISEAIASLKRVGPIGKVEYSSGMSRAAKAQLENLQADITLGHSGRDGNDVEGRLFQVGFPGKATGENIAIYSKTGIEAVLQMVIDDGLKSRIHRQNLLTPDYTLVGIAFGTGKNNVGICVLVFADKFKDR